MAVAPTLREALSAAADLPADEPSSDLPALAPMPAPGPVLADLRYHFAQAALDAVIQGGVSAGLALILFEGWKSAGLAGLGHASLAVTVHAFKLRNRPELRTPMLTLGVLGVAGLGAAAVLAYQHHKKKS